MVRIAVGLVVVVGILLTGGSRSVAGGPGAGDTGAMPMAAVRSAPDLPPAPPATVRGGAGTASDRLAADVVTGVEQFWREQFPVQFGRRWVNIHAFYAVDPGDATVPAPCLRQPSELADQGLFCPRLDVVAWDRTGLLPRLRAS
ncbi:MAG: hypothetical protein QOH45_1405 [Pseudonocardiales bacterium]|nr:hypothetical protein [Pseudonocardiales bacterium]